MGRRFLSYILVAALMLGSVLQYDSSHSAAAPVVRLTKKQLSLKVQEKGNKVVYGTAKLKVKASKGVNIKSKKYSVKNKSIAKVSPLGKFTAKNEGSTVIIVKVKYAVKKKTVTKKLKCKVTVKEIDSSDDEEMEEEEEEEEENTETAAPVQTANSGSSAVNNQPEEDTDSDSEGTESGEAGESENGTVLYPGGTVVIVVTSAPGSDEGQYPGSNATAAPAVTAAPGGSGNQKPGNTPSAQATLAPSKATPSTACPSSPASEDDDDGDEEEKPTATPKSGSATAAPSASPIATPAEEDPVYDLTDLSAPEIISEMGTGVNIGNTFDAVKNFTTMEVSETAWGASPITEDTFTHIADLGFKSVRIPVTWGDNILVNATESSTDYSIKSARLARIKEVVDAAIDAGLYVVINIHHDGASDNASYGNFLQLSKITNDASPIYGEFAGVWKSIATYFKNYDEHLLFESMNEVYENGEYLPTETEIKKINRLNQLFVNTVRGTGGNNQKRWLVVPCRNTNIDHINDVVKNSSFVMPTDTLGTPRLMLSVHSYTNPNRAEFDTTTMQTLGGKFKTLKEQFIDDGYPVFLGEYGPASMTNDTFKTSDENNIFYYEVYNYLAKKYGIIPMAWDISTKPDHMIVDRADEGNDAAAIISAIMKGYNDDTVDTDLPGMEEVTENSIIFSYGASGSGGGTGSLLINEDGDYTYVFKDTTPFNLGDSGTPSNWYIQTSLPRDNPNNVTLSIKSGYATMQDGSQVTLTPLEGGVHALEGEMFYQVTLYNPWNSNVNGFENIFEVDGAESITIVINVSGMPDSNS